MTFDIVLIGYTAGLLSSIAQFPQAYKVIKTDDTRSISPGMYSIMTTGIFFWLIYGFMLNDLPMILANLICIFPSLFVLYRTLRNIRRIKKQSL